tara:strand:+ start:658 stop:2181 length:1524 start_codon:yes stop_codon:yes gene_type:complete
MKCPKCNGTRLHKNGKAESGRTRYKCIGCNARTTNPNQEVDEKIAFQSTLPKSNKYIFTAAQNATPVHKGFLASLRHFAKRVGAELVVIPFRYKNPTSNWSADNESIEWWDRGLARYLFDGRFNLNKHLTILADVKVQPTAVTPLTGLESITGERSGIVGHTKIQLQTVPTPSNKMPKIMATTGSVTIRNYSDTKSGKKGEFYHSFGAAMVEIDGDQFHLRQINACNDGSFIDLDVESTPKGCRKAKPAKALIMGDSHVDFIDPDVVKATFTDKGSIVESLRPTRLVWHDLLDFYSRNHHHRNDPITALVKHQSGMGDVRGEIERACAFVDKHTPSKTVSIIVPSNHPEAMARWIRETDWRFDPENAEFYLETALALVKSAHMTPHGATCDDPFAYWAKQLLNTTAEVLTRDDSYVIDGIELGMHGDKGPNGARGSIRNMARTGTKTVIGHSHSPGIFEGCVQTGTSTRLKLEYTSGPSSWLQTHCVIYANGKRSLLNIVNGKWHNA